MLGLLKCISIIAAKYGVEPELKRKIAHIATGMAILPAPWVFTERYPVVVIVALALGAMALLRSKWFVGRSMNTVLHDVQRKSYGEFYLLFAIGFLFMTSKDSPILFVLPVTIIALSDAASALVGTVYGRKRLEIPGGQKSVEGVITFFVVTLIVSLILLMLMTDVAELNVILLSILIAGFCAYVERDSWRGLDNLFVPIGAHLLLIKLLSASLSIIAAAMLFIAISFAVLKLIAPALKLTKHAARSYGILIILMLCATEVQNVILPIIAIGAHLLARRSHPAKGRNRDLEMIAVTATVGMLWLFVGEFTSYDTTNLFGLTYAGAALIFFGLFLDHKFKWFAIFAFPVLYLIFAYVSRLNVLASNWDMKPMLLFALASILPVMSMLFLKKYFDRYRSVKVFAISIIAPMGIHLTAGVLQ